MQIVDLGKDGVHQFPEDATPDEIQAAIDENFPRPDSTFLERQSPLKAASRAAVEGVAGQAKGFGLITEIMPSVSDPAEYAFMPPDVLKIHMDRARRTPAQVLADVSENPLYAWGKKVQAGAEEAYPLTATERAGVTTKLAGGLGSFLPFLAEGPLGIAGIGLQTAGERLETDFQKEVDKGKSPDDAASATIGKALGAGTLQSALFAVLPPQLRKLGDKFIDKFVSGVVSRFLLGRLTHTTEGAALGTASAALDQAVSGELSPEQLADSAFGLGLAQLFMPRGLTRREVEARQAFEGGPSRREIRDRAQAQAWAETFGAGLGPPRETQMVQTSPEVFRGTGEPPRPTFLRPVEPQGPGPGAANVPSTPDITGPVNPWVPPEPGPMGVIPPPPAPSLAETPIQEGAQTYATGIERVGEYPRTAPRPEIPPQPPQVREGESRPDSGGGGAERSAAEQAQAPGKPEVVPVANIESIPATENGARIAIVLPNGTAVVGGKFHADTWIRAVNSGIATDAELANGFAGFVKPDGTAWGVNGKALPKVSQVYIVGTETPKPPARPDQRPPEPAAPSEVAPKPTPVRYFVSSTGKARGGWKVGVVLSDGTSRDHQTDIQTKAEARDIKEALNADLQEKGQFRTIEQDVAEQEAPAAPKPTHTPADLEPALLVNGVPETGGKNHGEIKDTLLSKAKNQDERNAILEAFLDDNAHIFVDKAGKQFNRVEAAKAIGELDPLQSERLADLKAKEPPPKQYAYRSLYRPVMSLSQYWPKGWKMVDENTVAFEKPLTGKQIEQWQLEPLDPNDPINIKKAYNAFREDLMNKLSPEYGALVKLKDGRSFIVSDNIGDAAEVEKYPFRITTIQADGTPSGHMTFRDWDEVIRNLWGWQKETVSIESGKKELLPSPAKSGTVVPAEGTGTVTVRTATGAEASLPRSNEAEKAAAMTAEPGATPGRQPPAGPRSPGLTEEDGVLFAIANTGKLPMFIPPRGMMAEYVRMRKKYRLGGMAALSAKERDRFRKMLEIFPENFEDDFGVNGEQMRAAYEAAKKAGIENEIFRVVDTGKNLRLDVLLKNLAEAPLGGTYTARELYRRVEQLANAHRERKAEKAADVEGQAAEADVKAARAFNRDVSVDKPGTRPLAVADLRKGAQFKLKGTKLIVEALDFDEDGNVISVTLRDGAKYGTRVVEGNVQLRMDEGSLKLPKSAETETEWVTGEIEEPPPAAPAEQPPVASVPVGGEKPPAAPAKPAAAGPAVDLFGNPIEPPKPEAPPEEPGFVQEGLDLGGAAAKPSGVQERPLTKAEQEEFRQLSIKARSNREAGGPPLTTEETQRYEYLGALAGQKSFGFKAPEGKEAIRGQIKALASQLNRLYDEKPTSSFGKRAEKWRENVRRVEKQIRELRTELTEGEGEFLGETQPKETPAGYFGTRQFRIRKLPSDEVNERFPTVDQRMAIIKQYGGLDNLWVAESRRVDYNDAFGKDLFEKFEWYVDGYGTSGKDAIAEAKGLKRKGWDELPEKKPEPPKPERGSALTGGSGGLADVQRIFSNLPPAEPTQAPTGNWYFGGGVAPLVLRFERVDGKPLTPKEAEYIQQFGISGDSRYQTRTWNTKEEALAAQAELRGEKAPEAPKPVEAPKPAQAPEGSTVNGWVKYKGGWYKLDESGKLPMVQRKAGGEGPKYPPANTTVSKNLEAEFKRGPAPEDTRSPQEILKQASQVRVKLPEGATVLRVTDTKGKSTQIFIADLNKGENVLRGVDIGKLEAGFINKEKKFEPIKGDVKVSEVRKAMLTAEEAAREPSRRAVTMGEPIKLETTADIRRVLDDKLSNITQEHRKFFSWLLDKGLLDKYPGLRMEVVDEIQRGAGSQMMPSGEHIGNVSRFLRWTDSDVPLHEFMHHIERFLSPEDRAWVEQERLRYLREKAPQLGDTLTKGMTSDQFMASGLSRDLYHLSNPSEFFAWLMTEKGLKELNRPEATTFVGRVRELIKDLWQGVKRAFGLQPYEDTLWQNILKGKVEYDTAQAIKSNERGLGIEDEPIRVEMVDKPIRGTRGTSFASSAPGSYAVYRGETLLGVLFPQSRMGMRGWSTKGQWFKTRQQAIDFLSEARNLSLIRTTEQREKELELGRVGAIGQSPYQVDVRITGAYGDPLRMIAKEADDLNISDGARRVLGMPRKAELWARAQAAIGGKLSIFGYQGARDWAKDKTPNERWQVTSDALRSLGNEEADWRVIDERFEALKNRITSPGFVKRLESLARLEWQKDVAVEKEETYRNVRMVNISKTMNEISKAGIDSAQEEILRQDIAAEKNALNFATAVGQRMDAIVSKVFPNYFQFGASSRSAQGFYDLYLSVMRGEGTPVTDPRELAYLRFASETLAVNRYMRERLYWLEAMKREPDLQTAINDFGKAFVQRLQANPGEALRELISGERRVATKAERAATAWKTLNSKLMRDLNDYAKYEEAKQVKDRVQASADWQNLVRTVHTDAEALHVPPEYIEQIKKGYYDEANPVLVEIDPAGKAYTIDLGFTKETAAKAQGEIEAYLQSIRDWLYTNKEHPDAPFWQRKLDFIDSVYNTMTVTNPTAVKPFGFKFFRMSWGMPQYLFSQMKIPGAKIVQSALENWRRSQSLAQNWLAEHTDRIVRMGRKAAQGHGYNVFSPGWIQAYREAMFNSIAWRYRHNLPVKEGMTLNGFKVTKADIEYLKGVGAAENQRYRQIENLGIEKSMPEAMLFDKWRENTFSIRRPQEFGTEPLTTVSRERSQRGKLLSTSMAKLDGKDFSKIQALLETEEAWPWVVRWLNERSPDYTVLTPWEPQLREVYNKMNERLPNVAGEPLDTIDSIAKEIAANVPEEYTEAGIKEALLSQMHAELTKHFNTHYKTEPNPDIRVIAATRESSFTRAFQHDTTNSYAYDYGLTNAQELHSFAIDSSMYWLSRFQRGLDGLIRHMNDALAEIDLVKTNPAKLAALKERNRDLFNSGDDFRDYEDLQWHAAELRKFRDTIGIWSGQQGVANEGLTNMYRFTRDMAGWVLSGWRTLARVFWGSTVKEGFTMGALERFSALSTPKSIASMAISLSRVLTVGPATLVARRLKILPKFEQEVSGIAEEWFRVLKFFDAQYPYGLGFKTPTYDAFWNVLTMPVTRGGRYMTELSSNRAMAMVQRGLYHTVSAFEAPLELVKTVFPTLGYAVQYDSVCRQIYWWLRGLEKRARRTFNTYEQMGKLDRFDFNNPKNPKNALTPQEVIGDGIFPATMTALSHNNEMFKRGTNMGVNDAIMMFWKRLKETPPERRGEVHLLSADMPIGTPQPQVLRAEQARFGALATSGLLDIHHSAIVNRTWSLRASAFGRLAWPLAGWAVQSTKQWFAVMGYSAGDPRFRSVMMRALTYAAVAAALGTQIIMGDAEKRIFEELKWLVNGEIDPVKHLGQGADKKETARIAISDMMTYITMLNGYVDSILSAKANRQSLTDSIFVVQQIKSLLQYVAGVAQTHDPLYGLPALAKRGAPITQPFVNRLPVTSGIVARNNARTIIQKWAPPDLNRQTGSSFGMPTATELTPYKEKLAAAIYNSDSLGTAEAYAAFIDKAQELGRPDPENLAKQTVRSLNPYSIALIAHPTDEQRAAMLEKMPQSERDHLLDYENRYAAATQMLGISSEMTRQDRGKATGGTTASASGSTAGFSGGGGASIPSGTSGRRISLGGGGGGGMRTGFGGGFGVGMGPSGGRAPVGPGLAGRRLSLRPSRARGTRLVRGRLRSRSGRTMLARGRTPKRRRLSLIA